MNALPQLLRQTDARVAEEAPRQQFRLRCPVCAQDMDALDAADTSLVKTCSVCGFTLLNHDGIWRALAPDREERFRQFVRDYQKVRALEGRGSSDAEFYLNLPYTDSTGRHSWQWKIRGRSFRCFENRILPPMEQGRGHALDVLDLGAGNCWLSHRLALRGHNPMAVDLIDNAEDGLGAARHYLARLPNLYPRFQAEMDRLPFQDQQFDLAIFNASFHYSEDYHCTVGEALRCLRRPGWLVIMDSPFYLRDVSGRQMVQERMAAFAQRFGFASDSLAGREYLTGEILEELGRKFQLAWKIARPWYGVGWALRPFKAHLLRRREPSKFFIFWAKVD